MRRDEAPRQLIASPAHRLTNSPYEGYTADSLAALESGPLAQRFGEAMGTKLAQLAPYCAIMSELAGALMNPRSKVALLGANTVDVRQHGSQLFVEMVRDAAGPLRKE